LFCSKCGTQLNEGSMFCSRCGAQVAPVVEQVAADVSPKSRLATTLLAFPWLVVGLFGAHRFYTGKIGTAVIMLVMAMLAAICYFGGLFAPLVVGGDESALGPVVVGGVLYFAVWVWAIIDFIIAVTGNFKDSQGKTIKKW
jgi:TM2 domain-containing membrane protein YozV